MARKRVTSVTTRTVGIDEIPVDFSASEEPWNEYRLKDGSTIRLRPVVVAIVRLKDKFTEEGEPIYRVKSTMIMHVDAPKKLRRKKKP